MRKIIALCALLAILVSCAPSVETVAPSITTAPSSDVQSESMPEPPPPEPKVVRFSATGDNLIHDGLYSQAKRRAGGDGYDFKLLYENVESYYDNFDVNFINQETLITDVFEPSTYPNFCSPEALGRHMYDEVGFNVFATSNNHSYDKGAKGIQGSLDFYYKMPEDLVSLGFYNEETWDVAVHEVNGIRIAYLAYSQYTNGIPIPQNAPARVILTSEQELIKQQIEQAKGVADFVVVGVHWGNEDTHTATEGQQVLGKQMVDWGADVIVGTHPHVVQPIEWYDAADGRKALIIYSLGNFVSAQSKAPNLIGLSVGFDIVLEPDGLHPYITNTVATPIVTHYDSDYGNIRAYLFKDYTAELANKHGVRAKNSAFSMEFIENTLTKNISEEFLKLD